MAGFFSNITLPEQLTLSYAIGRAAGEALTPFIYDLINEANQGAVAAGESRPLPFLAAAGVAAEDVATYDAMVTEASFSGYDATRFKNLYGVTLSAPGIGELLNMLRRDTISGDLFTHGLRKARFEPEWDAALKDLRTVYIGIGDIATAIVRGAVPAPSWVPVAPPTTTDHVPRFPVTKIDPVALAAKLGYSEDMLRIMTARSGLSLAPILATQANFRGVLTDNDWLLAIAEGDLRTEWADTLREAARAIPSDTDFVQGRLRGWINDAAMYAGTARHGMTQADTDLLFKIHGRPLSFHQVFIGLRRGGVYDGPTTDIAPAFLTALRQSDIRPEWYNLAWAQRYTYPTAFVLRTLTEAGDLTQAETEQILLFEGWEPTLATKVSTKWAGGTGTTDGAHVSKAQTQLWNTTHKSYVAREIDDPTATAALEGAGVTAAEIPAVLSTWNQERDLIRKQLTPKEIVKAVNDGITNPATGGAWTVQDAVAALQARGYDAADALAIVEEG